MALITRVARLFRADLHAVLDRIEEPDILLRQAVRDMEEELAGDQQRLKLLNHEQEQIEARVRELDPTLQEIEEQLQVCFDAGKDDLARALIRRRLETQGYSKHLQRRRAMLQETLAATGGAGRRAACATGSHAPEGRTARRRHAVRAARGHLQQPRVQGARRRR